MIKNLFHKRSKESKVNVFAIAISVLYAYDGDFFILDFDDDVKIERGI